MFVVRGDMELNIAYSCSGDVREKWSIALQERRFVLGRKIQKRTLVPGRGLNELRMSLRQANPSKSKQLLLMNTEPLSVRPFGGISYSLPAILTPYDEARRYKGWGGGGYVQRRGRER